MERRLYRSATDKYIGGVCGGLAEYFNVDPALVRIIFVLMLFANGFGLLTYLIMWVAVRRRPANAAVVAAGAADHPSWGRYLPGALLILLGLFFLIQENWRWFDLDFYFERFWPLLLIGVGLLLVLYRGHDRESNAGTIPSSPSQPHNGEASV
jgi:phage shock protein C